jgi:hypothetical protein
MADARKFSEKTPVLQWDNAKIRQAQKEYLQCDREAADFEDRFKAGRGLTYTMEILAYQDYLYATNVNIYPASKAVRRSLFDVARARAIHQYDLARRMATLVVDGATRGDLDTGDFEAWAQHNISYPLAELKALSFETLRTARQERAMLAPPTPRPKIVQSRPPRLACAHPNVPATTIRAIEPDTPPAAAQQGISGTAQVVVSLDADSHVTAVRIQSAPSAILVEAALDAARNSTFQTEVRDCKPIAADYIFSVEFTSQ